MIRRVALSLIGLAVGVALAPAVFAALAPAKEAAVTLVISGMT